MAGQRNPATDSRGGVRVQHVRGIAGRLTGQQAADIVVAEYPVSASLSTSLTSLVLVCSFGAMPKRWFNDAP